MSFAWPSKSERPCIFGILNITPDSFSDGGNFVSTEAANFGGPETPTFVFGNAAIAAQVLDDLQPLGIVGIGPATDLVGGPQAAQAQARRLVEAADTHAGRWNLRQRHRTHSYQILRLNQKPGAARP